ncbi:MAG TPA: carboxymuconolactone decarboxylase family protein [Terriglobales bacterium]
MQPRIDITKISLDGVKAMLGLENYLHHCGLEEGLLHLLKLRVSQMNGCAYCLDMHWKDLKAIGENEQRLYSLDAWRETPFYSERERAALAWAEALTNITHGHVPDELFEETRRHFSEKEIVDLTLAVTTINAWNRISISTRAVPGTYQPKGHRQARVAGREEKAAQVGA